MSYQKNIIGFLPVMNPQLPGYFSPAEIASWVAAFQWQLDEVGKDYVDLEITMASSYAECLAKGWIPHYLTNDASHPDIPFKVDGAGGFHTLITGGDAYAVSYSAINGVAVGKARFQGVISHENCELVNRAVSTWVEVFLQQGRAYRWYELCDPIGFLGFFADSNGPINLGEADPFGPDDLPNDNNDDVVIEPTPDPEPNCGIAEHHRPVGQAGPAVWLSDWVSTNYWNAYNGAELEPRTWMRQNYPQRYNDNVFFNDPRRLSTTSHIIFNTPGGYQGQWIGQQENLEFVTAASNVPLALQSACKPCDFQPENLVVPAGYAGLVLPQKARLITSRPMQALRAMGKDVSGICVQQNFQRLEDVV